VTRTIISSSLLMAILTLVFTLTLFLSKTMFDDARAIAGDFRTHERISKQDMGDLHIKDIQLQAQIDVLAKGVSEANRKLDWLIEKHVKLP